jgi:predicted Zn-dependent peptidase
LLLALEEEDRLLPAQSTLSSSLAASLESRVHEYTLSNGLRLIVVPRVEDGPILSVTAHHNTGAWDEPNTQTGYAHLLEHMMFKGTPRTGLQPNSWKKERAALERVDDAFEAVRSARREAGLSVEGYSIGSNGSNGSSPPALPIPDTIAKLEAELARCVADAAQYSRQEQGYGARLQSAGAVGLNAATSHDETRYFCSLPANKLELWMSLESERLVAPVFRQLHEEKKVVAEERRARVDASPRGRFVAAMAERAFLVSGGAQAAASSSSSSSSPIPPTRTLGPEDNPYGRPVLGYREDLAAVGRRELAAFFRARYSPNNAVLAVVGDVATATGVMGNGASAACDRVAAMAERYFCVWGEQSPSRPPPSPPLLSDEPLPRFSAAAAGNEFVARSAAGPSVYLAYPRPSLAAGGRDAVALEAACDALASGRASRFGRQLIRPGLALGASLVPGWPGDKHAGAALAAAVAPEGQAADEKACRRLAKRMQDEADRLVESGVTEAELARVKRGAAVGLLSATQSNAGLAGALAAYEATTPGGWRALLVELGELEALTREQVRVAAERTFGGEKGRFLAVMLPGDGRVEKLRE